MNAEEVYGIKPLSGIGECRCKACGQGFSDGYVLCWNNQDGPYHARCSNFNKPTVDFVSLQDYENAIDLLRELRLPSEVEFIGLDFGLSIGAITQVGKAWRERAILSLNDKIDRRLRDSRVPRDQQQFMAMMKKMALGYQEDAQALFWAAARLKNKHHDIHGASETHKAALVAARAAQELIGED